ncbi:MAG: peptide chain release factor N(5)-glutamine methyltransferase [Pirellulaceae bacterium]
MTDELWNTKRLLSWTTQFLQKHHTDSPRLDAEVLLAHARQCDRITLYTSFEEEVDDRTRGTFRELIQRRAAGCPVAYLVGHREFFSLSFDVTSDVLIPRPETEFLVMTALDWAKHRSVPPRQIIDVGTGCGVVAICLAKYLPETQILATDISTAAIEVARRNAARHNVADRIRFVEADLVPLDELAACDAVVSNPPYIGLREANTLDRDVREHEPHAALFGGECGEELTQRLFQHIGDRLPENAAVMVEINSNRSNELREFVSKLDLYQSLRILDDLAGLPRLLTAERTCGGGPA